ncbi:hypothetical protein [Winogradskyella sp. 3972H.M.0a.05]|uniref:TolB family protein n=1 Tax=Winogradskyella sp. 3972H.M.0a.05 TaxID=2950277 RepID=UPI003393259E
MNVKVFVILVFFVSQCIAQQFNPPIPDNYRIAYISYSGETPDIFMMNPNVMKSAQLTDSEMSNSFPQDFGDGQTLLFTKSKTGNGAGGKLYTLNIFSKVETPYNPSPITTNAKQERKNKQGTHIAYTKEVDNFRELFVYDISTKKHVQVSQNKANNNPAQIEMSFWSFDGNQVAYLSGKDYYNLYLRVYNLTSQKTTTVTPKGFMFAGLVWLKDNSSFVINIARRNEFSYELFGINLDGSNFKQLTNDPSKGNIHPDISPDGNWIVFESGRGDESNNIYLMRPDGSNQIKLTSGKAYHGRPAWFEMK